MQNTTEKTVEKKSESTAAAVETPVYKAPAYGAGDMTAPATAPTQVSSMAEQLEADAPEKRKVFRKACNHTARSVLWQLLVMSLVQVIVLVVYGVIAAISNDAIISAAMSGNMTAMEQSIAELFSGKAVIFWIYVGTAIGGTLANITAALLHSKKRGYKYGESFKEGRMTTGLFFGGLVVGMGAMYLWAYLYSIIQLVSGFTDPLTAQSETTAYQLLTLDNIAGLIVYCAYVCLLGPITEEYLFRGVLLKTLSKYNIGFAAVATSLLFGLLHANLNQTPGAFLFGLVMAYVAIRSGSIRTPIILHILLNTYSTVMSILVVNMPEMEQTTGIVSVILNVLLIVGALVIVIVGCAKKKFKWEPADPTTNHTLLPKAKSRVKLHYLHFFTCFWVLVFIYICVESILANAGLPMLMQLAADAIANAVK